MEQHILSLKDLGNILKNRLSMIIVSMLITTIASVIITYFIIEPTYTTTATLLIGKAEDSQNGAEYNNGDVTLYKQLMGTYGKVVQSEDLIQRVIDESKLNLTTSQILNSLEVISGTEDQILTLKYTSKDKKEGIEVLNPLIEEFGKTSKEIIRNGEMFVLNTPKIPLQPSAPNKKMNIMVGIILGAVIGVVLSLILESIDDSVKSNKEIEDLIGVPVIGNIPLYGTESEELTKKSRN